MTSVYSFKLKCVCGPFYHAADDYDLNEEDGRDDDDEDDDRDDDDDDDDDGDYEPTECVCGLCCHAGTWQAKLFLRHKFKWSRSSLSRLSS